MNKKFKHYIKYIGNIDYQILKLISHRAKLVSQIQLADDKQNCSYNNGHEDRYFYSIKTSNKGPLSNKVLSKIFKSIVSACLKFKKKSQVAYLGPEGTFTQQAVLKYFGKSIKSIPVKDVFRTIENKIYNYGVVPVENSTEGIVNNTFDSFISSNLKICGEIILSIHHHLLIDKQNINKNIDKIYSHQQSFSQCRDWLKNNYPNAKKIAVASNAEASNLTQYKKNSAAIAGDLAASYYSLIKLAKNIEDRINNYTRFLILSDKDVAPTGYDKTYLMIYINNQIGSFYLLIEPFYRYNINILRLTTRPAPENKGVWNYIIFLEIKGHRKSKLVEKTLEEIYMRGAELKILGSFPEQLTKRI
ncbi:bifunctional chorismate mutase/prephenate dehydratase [Candidatus Portiera aleyrodidarum]|uniref:bifunctional chorismate mutase/prephenate dehydratase n=1 Tax=Candidatus Portiera aleyrodidarum TaxID=91844 RepID=UPI000C78E8A6|nr:prephenate dehydratase [Candidatus Portiera aleyrodidarum]AUI73033.1 prephenate dehydratase [Candidatus Portiera aleyrodidarum]